MKLLIEVERETDGRWIAEAKNLPGVMCYGETKPEAIRTVRVLAMNVIADNFVHGETLDDL